VPTAIAVIRQPNAQVKARELIIVLVSFGFIIIVSFCLSFLVLAFFGFSLLSCHFWPFIEVLRKIFGSLTREVWKSLQTPRIMRMSRIRTVGAAAVAGLQSMRASHLPLQLDYFGANETRIVA
jgi:hypothetical protein